MLVARRAVFPVLVALIASVGAACLSEWAFVTWPLINHWELDISPPSRISGPSHTVIVNVTAKTLSLLGLDDTGGVVPRGLHAEAIRKIQRSGARVLLFDYDFSQASKGDDELRRALSDTGELRVVLGAVPNRAELASGSVSHGFLYPSVLPKPLLPENVSVGALVSWEPDLVLRGVEIAIPDQNASETTLLHVSALAALGFVGRFPSDLRFDPGSGTWSGGGLSWPVSSDMAYRTSWPTEGPAVLDYADVIRGDPSSLRRYLGGKVVIVSSVLDSSRDNDMQTTEVGDIQGAQFLSSVIDSLLAPGTAQPHRNSIFLSILWSSALALGAYGCVAVLRWIPVLFGLASTLAIALVMPYFALSRQELRLDTVVPVLSILLASGAAFAMHGTKNKLAALRYTPAFVKEARVRGVEEFATIMFVDIQGSTPMALELGPQRTREIFRTVINELGQVVTKSGGEVERSLGDGFLAIFRKRGHADLALAAVPILHEEAARLSTRFEFKDEPLAITIGIESGSISGDVVKTIDESWSSFGIAIHTAARLQGECGKVGQSTLIGPDCRMLASDRFQFASVGFLTLKGLGSAEAYTLIRNEVKTSASKEKISA
jgi:class 3 adenylate cyclase